MVEFIQLLLQGLARKGLEAARADASSCGSMREIKGSLILLCDSQGSVDLVVVYGGGGELGLFPIRTWGGS